MSGINFDEKELRNILETAIGIIDYEDDLEDVFYNTIDTLENYTNDVLKDLSDDMEKYIKYAENKNLYHKIIENFLEKKEIEKAKQYIKDKYNLIEGDNLFSLLKSNYKNLIELYYELELIQKEEKYLTYMIENEKDDTMLQKLYLKKFEIEPSIDLYRKINKRENIKIASLPFDIKLEINMENKR